MQASKRPRRPTQAAVLVLVVGVIIVLIAMLATQGSVPTQQEDKRPTSTASHTSPPKPTVTNATIEPTWTAWPALLGNLTPTPRIFLPQATTTLRPTSAANRYRRVRCDNPNYWSLPIADSQYGFSAGFGIQPVGSVYYEGLLERKLITPLPTFTPTATMPPNTTATATATPTLTPTANLSGTVEVSFTATLTPGVMHPGVDIPLDEDTPIYAVANGQVSSVTYSDVYGLHVILDIKGYQILYGHLNENLVEEGQRVNCGQLIGRSGATGTYQTGPHLHFEVRQKGQAIDPMPLLQQTLRASLPSDLKAQIAVQEKFSNGPDGP